MKYYQISFKIRSDFDAPQDLGSELLDILLLDFLEDEDKISDFQVTDLETEEVISIKTE